MVSVVSSFPINILFFQLFAMMNVTIVPIFRMLPKPISHKNTEQKRMQSNNHKPFRHWSNLVARNIVAGKMYGF